MKRSYFARALTLAWAAALLVNLVPASALEPTAAPAPQAAAAQAEAEPEPGLPALETEPTPEPSAEPAPEPSAEPTPEPSAEPAPEPSAEPTPEPSAEPSPEASPAPEETEPGQGTSSFSLRIVTPGGESFVHTYRFYNGDTLLDTQILSPGETLTEPAAPGRLGEVFEGWLTAEGTPADFTAAEPTLTQDLTTDFFASFRPVYYVFYMSEATGGKIIYTQSYDTLGQSIDWEQVPFAAPEGLVLTGWSQTPGGPAEASLQVASASLTLYPVLVEGHWLRCHTLGGEPVNPVYLSGAEVTQPPAEPTRKGYLFAGWYADSTLTTPFVFGAPLQADTDIYAAWTPGKSTYKVVYWQQNADDNGYSLAEVESHSGTTGADTALEPGEERYPNFTLKEAPVQETIAADGSTVVHVYYDRNVYQVKFYDTRKALIEELTIEARYGADIADQWPSRVDSKWPSLWLVQPQGSQYQSGLATMPAPGDDAHPNTFYQQTETGRVTHEIAYYLQGLDGKYTLDHTDTFKSNTSGWKISENDFYAIKGFTVNWKLSPAVGEEEKWLGFNRYGWKLYYDRSSYAISFYNGTEKEKEVLSLYGADISGAYYEPKAPAGKEGWQFTGWYTNSLLQGEPYSFAGKTMADYNFPLYAGWAPPTCLVRFDLAGGTAPEGDPFAAQAVIKNAQAHQPDAEPLREGYSFVGWACEGELFSFASPIREDITLQALWLSNTRYTLSYSPGAGQGEVSTDSRRYAEGAKAGLAQPPADWQPPSGDTGFLCWNTRPDGSGEDYQPGELFTMPASNTTLYARWAKVRCTTLTYDYNGGTGADGKTSATETISTPGAEYTIDHPLPTRSDYRFIGWSLDAEGTRPSPLLQTGSTIRVDTLNEEENCLYAQWEAVTVTTVSKQVAGNQGELDRDFTFYYSVDGGPEKSFTLRHGQSRTLEPVAAGSTLTVREADYTAEGYTTTREDSGTAKKPTILFTNTRQVEPPTGLWEDSRPWRVMILLGFGLLGRVWETRRRRKGSC